MIGRPPTISSIKRFVAGIPDGQLFTTREVLIYGKRAAVDQALCRLVAAGFVERVARGVFVRFALQRRIIPVLEIAIVKAEAFGRTIITHAQDAAANLRLVDKGNEKVTFAIGQRSSSFKTTSGTVIRFRGTTSRKMSLADKPYGLVLRSLNHLKEANVRTNIANSAISKLNREERMHLRMAADLVPAWLSDFFAWIRLPRFGSRRDDDGCQYPHLRRAV